MRILAGVIIGLMLFGQQQGHGFALLGPFEPWMGPTNGHRLAGDIGGAMSLTNEYRWNVPVLTYGFDDAFLDYFGTGGVVAVEQALQILNDLPPASELYLTNFSLAPRAYNYSAMVSNFWDLKTTTLSLVLEQMGLAEPTRHIFALREWSNFFVLAPDESSWGPELYDTFILRRNYDPETLIASSYVNNTLHSASALISPSYTNATYADLVEIPVSPMSLDYTAIRDDRLIGGLYFYGLSRDDVGGWRYLHSSNNLNFEVLVPDVRGAGPNADNYVNAALRPGVEKIMFVPHPRNSQTGQFQVFTNQFTDTYVVAGNHHQQQLERVTTQPDFLFRAADTGAEAEYTPVTRRTDTSHWQNNALFNGSPGAGPGIIRPPVRIDFNREGLRLISSETPMWTGSYASIESYLWASFDSATNSPIVYPTTPPTNSNPMIVRLRLSLAAGYVPQPIVYTWQVSIEFGAAVALQTSTNLVTWETYATVENEGRICDWIHTRMTTQRFFRVVPE